MKDFKTDNQDQSNLVGDAKPKRFFFRSDELPDDAKVMSDAVDREQKTLALIDEVRELKAAGNLVISDMVTLLENQRINPEDGSYLLDGQSCHELNILINKES